MENKCKKCGMATQGYKCDMCGTESAEHDAGHGCGGDHCLAKCSGCGEAETKCSCPAQN
ncbi:MAG: hypothetical protein AAB585_02360 [Patescibacteria group bacterium]